MKNEKVFSKNGFYMFVLESNILLHQHVAICGQKILADWLSKQPGSKIITVLDLACGGYPITISTMLAAFPDRKFNYTGVDINPDQVEALKTQFEFPLNVTDVKVIEGNAWDFSTVPLGEKYDVIFTGLNLHHGTPEEIHCLLEQCKDKLNQGGIFINHDFYRPSDIVYMRRPQTNPHNPSESYAMISDKTLAKYEAKISKLPETQYSPETDWRIKTGYFPLYQQILETNGAQQDCIDEVLSHMENRDFPISLSEMKYLTDKTGFDLQVWDLNASDEPFKDYFKLVSATIK